MSTNLNLQYGKDQRYYDLLSFLISNAVAGEIMAIENYSDMVDILDTTDEKIETVQQAHDESKHVQVLTKLGTKLNFPVIQKIIEPQWLTIRQHFRDAIRKGELASCLIIQDLMVETMAIVLYRTLGRDTDPDTKRFADNILADEIRHLDIGIDRIKRLIDKDPENVHSCLQRSHNSVMPELFSLISYSCHSLCGDLKVKCDSLGLDSINTDLETIKVDAMDCYLEMLDKVGFDVKVTTPLIARMSEYGVRPKADLSLSSDNNGTTACC